MVTNDIFFRNPLTNENENFMGHPSDHLVGGKTSHIRKMLELCIADFHTMNMDELSAKFADLKNRGYNIVPEQRMFGNFVLAKSPTYSFSKKADQKALLQLMKDNCDIVPCSELGFYCVSYLDKFTFYPKEEYFNPRKDLKIIQ